MIFLQLCNRLLQWLSLGLENFTKVFLFDHHLRTFPQIVADKVLLRKVDNFIVSFLIKVWGLKGGVRWFNQIFLFLFLLGEFLFGIFKFEQPLPSILIVEHVDFEVVSEKYSFFSPDYWVVVHELFGKSKLVLCFLLLFRLVGRRNRLVAIVRLLILLYDCLHWRIVVLGCYTAVVLLLGRKGWGIFQLVLGCFELLIFWSVLLLLLFQSFRLRFVFAVFPVNAGLLNSFKGVFCVQSSKIFV